MENKNDEIKQIEASRGEPKAIIESGETDEGLPEKASFDRPVGSMV